MAVGRRAAAAVAEVLRAAAPASPPCDAVRRMAAHGRAAVHAAAYHGVAPLLHDGLRRARLASLLTDAQREMLRAAYEHATLRTRELRRALAPVLAGLHEAGVPVVLLKGAALAETAYREPVLRPMTDVDLLVAEQDVERASDVLYELGLRRARGGPDTFAVHHGPPFVGGAAPVELHRQVVPGAVALALPAGDVIARSEPVVVLGGLPARVPDAADMLLHLCLHATHAHRMRARLLHLVDVRVTLERHATDATLDALAERASQGGARSLVYCALRLARDLVGAAVPPERLRALRRGAADDALYEHAQTLVLGGPLPPPGISRFMAARGLAAKGRVALDALRPARPLTAAGRRPSLPNLALRARAGAIAAIAVGGLGDAAEMVRARDAVSDWLGDWEDARGGDRPRVGEPT